MREPKSVIHRPIFCFLLLLTLGTSKRVDILSTSGEKVELKWEVRSYHDTDTWNEETYSGQNNSNERAYVSCNLNEELVDNWLFTPLRDSGNANRVHIYTNYSLRDCSNAGKYCKETFGLYYKLVPKGASDSLIGFNPNKSDWKLLSRLTGGERMRGNGLMKNEEIQTVAVDGSNVRFAFRDTGACVSILAVKIYYELCAEDTIGFATFPETPTASRVFETVDVKGRCVAHAEPIREGSPPMGMCRGDGQWKTAIDGECQCKAGYFPNAGDRCIECPRNTYKQRAGDGECRKCPDYTSSEAGSISCRCLPGYFRAATEGPSNDCSKPPSKPSRPRIIEVNQNSATIDWETPINLGGRKELWYRWECIQELSRSCPSTLRAIPSDAKLSSRHLKLIGLNPNTHYTIKLFAENEVSQVSLSETSWSSVEFSTLPIGAHTVSNLLVELEQNDGVTISWQSPAVAKGSIEYEVEVQENGTRRGVYPTQDTYYNIGSLRPNAKYEFRVRANIDGWGEWSLPFVYNQRNAHVNAEISRDGHPGGITELSIWVLVLLILVLMVFIVFLVFLCRRRSINRKQMSDLDVLDTYKQDTMTPDYPPGLRNFHQQTTTTVSCFGNSPTKVSAPLIPTYGLSSPHALGHYGTNFRPYVDPATYEDPNQALVEFTYDIDPQAIYITSVIGGGEFGDVCMGHLDRALANVGAAEKQIETVAIKTCKPGSSPKAKADFLLEASIMGQFEHPNVIRLIGVVTKAEPVMIVTEYMSNGSLDNFLRSRDINREPLQLPRLMDMLRGIAAGMKYLTDKGYVHRDLAARNVLVSSSLVCKIADFGLSRGVDNSAEQEYTTNGGKIPVRWTSPEAITHRKFTAASDVWSFGVVMWEVMSMGERPYWEWTNQKVISEVMHGYRLPAPMDCPLAIHKLMLWCWKMERHERPPFRQILQILERYTRNPELVHAEGPRSAASFHNLSGNYSSTEHQTPPSQIINSYNGSLDDFLRAAGLSHLTDQLYRRDIRTVSDLADLDHFDCLAQGLTTDEYHRIQEMLNGSLQGADGAIRIAHTQTLPHQYRGASNASRHRSPANGRSSTLARNAGPSADNGFFV